MRHRKNTRKLGRTSQHRDLMLKNMAASLIKHNRIETTLAKAKTLRPIVEKLVTLAKGGTLHDRRLAQARVGQPDCVSKLFKEIGPKFQERKGGYTRIIKLGNRTTDAAEMALIEWVDYTLPNADETTASAKAEATEAPAGEEKEADKPKKAAKKKAE
jgi:large subunit ribosomal protein L17